MTTIQTSLSYSISDCTVYYPTLMTWRHER